MADAGIKKTSVDLDGLLEVLGKNLYSTPSVALRELIQNAADACERHRIEGDLAHKYRIDVHCDPEENRLTIKDNGSGLARHEIEQFLATIGSGYSRLLRQRTQTEDVIGYFGLGFLSAYVVAAKVEVITSSFQAPEESWKFVSFKGKTYSVSPAEGHPVGTSVYLELDPEFHTLSDPGVIHALIRRYCCLLPVPIHLDGGAKPVNNLEAPWLLDPDAPPVKRRRGELEFAGVFESQCEPLACIPVPTDNEFGLKGLLWLQDGSSYASSDNRNISIFIRNMFITDEDKELLPRWAGFCGAALESAKFKPTASRESLQRDRYYEGVAEYLHELLAIGLRRIVLEEPETWRRVQARHNEALLGAAIADDRLFETTCRSLRVPTTEGDLTVPQLLSRGDGSIYIKPGARSGHEEVLFRVRGNPLVRGYLYGAAAFCRKYQSHHKVTLYELGTAKSRQNVFPLVDHTDVSAEALFQSLFASDNHELAFTRLEPAFIPLVVMEESEAVTKNRIESDEADKRISSAVLGLARLHTAATSRTKERTVLVNLDNPVIQQLQLLDDKKQKALGQMLTSLMEFLCLDAAQTDAGLDDVFSTFNDAMLALI